MRLIRTTLAATILAFTSPLALAGGGHTIEMYKNAGCGCCDEWAKHLEKNGFEVKVHEVADAGAWRRKAGIPDAYGSCHTAMVGGYAVEGHVPAADIKRLLEKRPKAVGIAVPGMPLGSPGMEQGGVKHPYEVLLVRKGGATEVFARH